MSREKAIGYVRVSTKKQVLSGASKKDLNNKAFSGHSIAEQKEKIKQFCEFKDFDLVNIFEDPGVSARKVWFFDRETGKEIVQFLKDNPEVRYLVVKFQDRMFRHTEDALHTVRVLKEDFNVDLYIQSNGDMVNLADPDQSLLFKIKAVLDDYQVAKNNQRTREVLQMKKKNGKLLGNAPLGAKFNKDRTKMLPDYSVLRKIAKAYRLKEIAGKSNKEVIKQLGIDRHQLRRYVNKYKEMKNL